MWAPIPTKRTPANARLDPATGASIFCWEAPTGAEFTSLWWCKSGDCQAPVHQIKFQTPFICGEPTSAYELPELLEVEVLPPWACKNVAVMLGPALPSSTEVNNRALMVDLGSFFTLSWLPHRALSCLHAANTLLSSGLSSEAWTSIHGPCPYQQVSVSSWGVQGGGQDLCAGLYSACQKTSAALFSEPLKLPFCLGWTPQNWMEFPG